MVGAAHALAAGLCLAGLAAPGWASSPTDRPTIRAGGRQMLALAEEMLKRGRNQAAQTIFELLTRDRDPDVRNEARFQSALLLETRSQYREAALLLRRILDEKPRAVAVRVHLARALQMLGDTDGALRELRAVQSTGLPSRVAQLIDRFSAALRAQRPQGASLEISIAPDTNINRATRSDSLGTVLGDFKIADDGKAKSGIGMSLSGQAFRRVRIDSDTNLLFRLSGVANVYGKSRFNDVAADVAAGPEFNLGRDRLQMELGGTQRWFGNRQFLRSARAGATLVHPLGRRAVLRLTATGALLDNQLNDLQDGRAYSGRLELERSLSATTGVAASMAVNREALDDPGYSTRAWRANLTAWREIGRLTFTTSGEFGRLHADKRLLLFPERRHDRYARLSIAASFRRLQYGGFAPLFRFSVERNRSNIAFYDYSRTRTEIGIVRAF